MTYYGVWSGRKVGIYTDWKLCSEQIKSYQGAKYKKLKATNQVEAEEEYAKGYKPNTKEEKQAKRESSSKSYVADLHKKDELVYFCDGACKKNPGSSAAGVSVYRHGEISSLHYGDFIEDGSNNISELSAMIFCLEKIKIDKEFAAVIYADSSYVINAITKWGTGWKKNGWRLASNDEVKNKDLVIKAYELYESLKDVAVIRKVKAHINEQGNELADRMAIHASNKKQKKWSEFEGRDLEEILEISHD